MGKFLVYAGEQSYGAEEIAACLGILTSMSGEASCLLAHIGIKGEGAEQGFHFPRRMDNRLEPHFSEEGMDALFRLSESGKLTRDNLMNYTLPILRGRLDLASGHERSSRQNLSAKERIYRQIWRTAAMQYDRIIVQGSEWTIQQSGPEPQDTSIVVLRQNKGILERFYNRYSLTDQTWRRQCLIALYPYDEASVLSTKNVKRIFGGGVQVVGIPHSTDFSNAWNTGEVLSFLLRNKSSIKKSQINYSFMNALRQLIDCCNVYDKASKFKDQEEVV
ncbi:hypothetical protein [Paenibacillus pinistramenti]|uniref:hypothetical protein n=1 Tax=Paenibacillus pinistramenti TaxID=1768003 RepID=UPI001108D7D8|nr:hypothetical protein [Paenibacillus pinistramenti]